MIHKNTIDDVVLALAAAPIDERTGNRVLYSVDWLADQDSMIGQINPDWVRRELDWFYSGSNKLEEMEPPVPALFKACAGHDGKVNSAYGHILFRPVTATIERGGISLFDRVVDTFLQEGKGTRHGVAIISDRDIHELAHYNGRNDFICTNALNFMIDDQDQLHIIAQMRSMDAVFGYRADYSMWNTLMDFLLGNLEHAYPELTRGDITFQVANLHVYPRHFQLLADTAADIEQRIERRVWLDQAEKFGDTSAQRAPIFGGRDEDGI
ncbi:thymidylate synthase [Microbacterium phage Zayuliv]|nr:thymidylate synthase [Microbacterium phage Zayuliv]